MLSGMKVKDLIETLRQLDEEMEVGYQSLSWFPVIGIKEIETGIYEYGEKVGTKKVIKLY